MKFLNKNIIFTALIGKKESTYFYNYMLCFLIDIDYSMQIGKILDI